ncbi:hypothetical protein EHS25_005662 [Saitozyma podzolica]|uniref:Uncharacterized protein n=1 Tax=Saitozyma podzolica TaxID=1890683 RepID=A0A427XVU7_9TREE|nr:hypothetical protein EHS25_005662 [Saitozyma podzolica]
MSSIAKSQQQLPIWGGQTLKDKYGRAVEGVGQMGVDEIQGIVETPEDAVAAVVLLDQITRNIYRGDLAAKVRPSASTYRQAFAVDHQAYRDFDPKALSLAKLFLAKPFGFGDLF